MKKILFLLLINYTLYANSLPTSINTTITSVTSDTVQVATSVEKGISGIVVHDYGNNLSAITHTLISIGDKQATIHPYVGLGHENIPNIKNSVVKGDKVIFGNFYNNLLLIAPNEEVYRKTKQTIKRSFIHPDIYAMDLIVYDETKLSLDNLKGFAQRNQVGLVLIAIKDYVMVLDPISSEYLLKFPISTTAKDSISPFYARFDQISNSLFGTEKNQKFLNYYEGIEQIK